jgi:hypothetical protein
VKKSTITVVGFLIITLALVGCESFTTVQQPSETTERIVCYEPTKIKVAPLTELVAGRYEDVFNVNVYVDVLDGFDSRMKTPAVFRFEAYEYLPRSGEEKGKRAIIWPDVDLTEPGRNNEYWRDYLRCYQFALDVGEEIEKGRSYVLQVTCITPVGEQLIDDFLIEYVP